MHWTHDTLAEASGISLPRGPQPLPWYARLMVGAAGWFGSLFLLFFLGLCLAGVSQAWVLVGLGLLAAAVFLQRSTHGAGLYDDAMEQAAFATALVGRATLLAGLSSWLGIIGACVVMSFVETALLLAFPTTLQRLASTIAIPTLWVVALFDAAPKVAVEGLGLLATALALAVLWARHPLERWAAQRDARAMWGHRSADRRVLSGLATDVGMGLAVWTLALEALRFRGMGGGMGIGLLYGCLAAALIAVYSREHGLTGRSLAAAAAGAFALVVLGSQVAGLPLAVAFALVALRTRHTLLAGLSLVFFAAYGVLFYYQLTATLLVKGGALIGSGLVVLALRSYARVPVHEGVRRLATPWFWRVAMGGVLLGTVGLVGAQVAIAEAQLAAGETVYLELGPVDPRSLVQGDYMILRYRLDRSAGGLSTERNVVATLDERGVVQSLRASTEAISRTERGIRLANPGGPSPIASGSYLFQEGTADAFAAARYGEFALLPNGRLMLVGLADNDLKRIGPSRSRW